MLKLIEGVVDVVFDVHFIEPIIVYFFGILEIVVEAELEARVKAEFARKVLLEIVWLDVELLLVV